MGEVQPLGAVDRGDGDAVGGDVEGALALDEAGLLPAWLKRGVLSEDGIYNLLPS